MRRKTTAPVEKILLRVAIYIRVSTDKQVKDGDSMRDQLATGQKYIDSHENMILVDTYIDDGISGQKLKRDDFQRLIDDVRAGRIDLIIFTRLDRWFRNLRHYLNTQDILDKHGVSWTAIEQPYFDTSTPHGRAFVNNSMIWAELEAQNDSDRILGVFDDKVDNGEVLSGSTPLGYKIVNKHLVPDDDAPTAVAIFQYYRKTGNLSMTLRYMESEFGLVRSAASLKNMLTNTKYIGEFRDNKEYCPAIIDHDLFYDVQRLLKINIKSGKKHDYIFSGLVVCDDCDHIMSGCQQRARGRVRADGTRITYKYSVYRCRQGVNLHRCPNRKLVFETTLESMLLDRIRPELEKYIAEYEVANLPALRTDAKRRSVEGKMQKLKDLYLNDLITMDEFKLDREKLLMQLEKINAEDSRPVKDLSYLKNFLKMDFESVYDSLSIPERRELWRSIVKEIRVDHDKNIHIIFL
ncbi:MULTISPECIES: recombinase family protein [Lachnospiraceae]|uniref:recombinase family protein n=1 Tax=Lachnospiraceae TaxID=186803 RepID=UPI000ADEA52E|nr:MULTISPECIES: recombinase family protein [Lachnospiraceae]MCB6722488.1 recombinase family protein [Blautia marasmi]MCG4750638.1 recombinase family protein [Blautia faecis]MCQ5092659.1 recombinase family protein [Blautia producta]